MFCSNCGTTFKPGDRFCGVCGTPASMAAPVVAAPVSGPSTLCPWCGEPTAAGGSSCPKCGATLNERTVSPRSGWTKLPGRRDMAKLQFGNSFCQIEGAYVPVADMNLAAGDGIYFTHHVLLWKDPYINITTSALNGAWKRMLAGMPLIMTQAQGPGRIAFSRDAPGETIALPLEPGQSIDVREHLFMVATQNVEYDWFSTNIWYTTQTTRAGETETETHYPVGMFMDRFSAPRTPGLLLLHASGNVRVRTLEPGQTMLVMPSALIFKDPSVQMDLHFETPRAGFNLWGNTSNRYLWLRVYGPGRIAVQSVFSRHEGVQNINGCSRATEYQW